MNFSVFGLFQTGDAAQGRALARAAWAQQGEELSVGNIDAQALNCPNFPFVNDEALP
jgi:hypothetical protein